MSFRRKSSSDEWERRGRYLFNLAERCAQAGDTTAAALLHEHAEHAFDRMDIERDRERAEIALLERLDDPIIAGALVDDLGALVDHGRAQIRAAARAAVEFPDGAR